MQFEQFLDNLQETYLIEGTKPIHSVQVGKKLFSIYENPSHGAVARIKKEADSSIYGLRLIVDLVKNKLYVFNSDLMHTKAAKELYGKYDSDDKHLFGFSKIDGSDTGFRNLLKRDKEYKKVRDLVDKNVFLTWETE